MYVGVNKNNGDYIILNGKSISDRNMNFKGYVFKMVFMNTIFLKIIFYIFLKITKSCKNISWSYVKINNNKVAIMKHLILCLLCIIIIYARDDSLAYKNIEFYEQKPYLMVMIPISL